MVRVPTFGETMQLEHAGGVLAGLCSESEICPQLIGLRTVLREHFLAPLGLGCRVPSRGDILRVVCELKRVRAKQNFTVPEGTCHDAAGGLYGLVLVEGRHSVLGYVHGIDRGPSEPCREKSMRSRGVGQVREQEALHERAHLASLRVKIDG